MNAVAGRRKKETVKVDKRLSVIVRSKWEAKKKKELNTGERRWEERRRGSEREGECH